MVTTKPTQEKLMKTVYCLYRVSTKGQVDKNDIPMQKQSCREFAENQPGWVIKKEFQACEVKERILGYCWKWNITPHHNKRKTCTPWIL